MGSYLSVENDTPHDYWVKVGPDQAALDISSLVVGALGLAAGSIAMVSVLLLR